MKKNLPQLKSNRTRVDVVNPHVNQLKLIKLKEVYVCYSNIIFRVKCKKTQKKKKRLIE